MREYTITKEAKGKKIFRFISEKLPSLKNGEIFKLLRKGVIKVNNRIVESNYEVAESDKVSVYLKEDHFKESQRVSFRESRNKFQSIKIDLDIIFEDSDIIVLNKERGLLTHSDGRDYKNSLVEKVKAYLFKKGEYNPKESLFTPAPCHRLDTNTSGIVIFAKNHETLKRINGYFKNNIAQKKYLTIVYGTVGSDLFLTSHRIKKDDESEYESKKNMVGIENFKLENRVPDKKSYLENNPESLATVARVMSTNRKVTYLEIELWTGSKHQIRSHLMMASYPLVGDQKYFSKSSYFFSERLNINSYFLHAYKLKLPDYNEFTAQLPDYFKKELDFFRL